MCRMCWDTEVAVARRAGMSRTGGGGAAAAAEVEVEGEVEEEGGEVVVVGEEWAEGDVGFEVDTDEGEVWWW